jgi:peptidoglycan-associated lipoprotein
MKNKRFLLLGIVVVLGLLALWGCPKKAEVTTTPATPKEMAPGESAPSPMRDEQAEKPMMKDESMERAKAAAAAGLQPVYFDFDQSFIRSDQRVVMTANAEWLKANPKVKIKIEGNCDERGTREYNQALGQRRATSAKKYLVDMGVSAKRVSLISYGKEKPACSESSESCWQKNRRGDLVAD